MFIRKIASTLHCTYRQAETEYLQFLDSTQEVILYFVFVQENAMLVKIYDKNNTLLSKVTFEVGDNNQIEKPIDLDKTINVTNSGNIYTDLDELLQEFNYINLAVLITVLWYIATTTKTTKYIYEKKTPVVKYKSKGIVQVSDTKFISTPIYDMQKIRVVKTESLRARKKGWTYTHAFEVHGHYRHYKNGKTIFIKPFVKGKDKELKSQTIIIDPKN